MIAFTSQRPPHLTQLPRATSGFQLHSDAGRVYHTHPPPVARGVRGKKITEVTEGPPPTSASWVILLDEEHMENEVEGFQKNTVHPSL